MMQVSAFPMQPDLIPLPLSLTVPLYWLCVLQHLQFLEVCLLFRKFLQYRESRHLGAISRLLVGRNYGMLTIWYVKSHQWLERK